jgi:hypothetical protein
MFTKILQQTNDYTTAYNQLVSSIEQHLPIGIRAQKRLSLRVIVEEIISDQKGTDKTYKELFLEKVEGYKK